MKNIKLRIASIVIAILYLSTSIIQPALANITYTYDANGNMTSDGTKCYTYNEANQVSKVTNCNTNQTVAQYLYDYQGNRIVKKVYTNGTLQKTVYSPNDSFETAKLATNSATQNTSYYYANSELIAKKNPDGSKTYFHNDNLNSASALTDQTGAIKELTTYYPFGEIRSGGTQSKYLYTGQENDPETNLDYYNARYYNPHIRRFTQPDNMLPNPYDPQQLNRYSYVNNNPLTYNDPSGHCPECLMFIAGTVTLAGLEVGGGIYGAATSPDQSLKGRLIYGVLGMQQGVESPVGKGALALATIGISVAAENPSTTSITGTFKSIQLNIQRIPKFSVGKVEWNGNELSIGSKVRVSAGSPTAVKKDGSPYTAAQLPHYHQEQKPQPKNDNARTSSKWHRPWETLFRGWFKK